MVTNTHRAVVLRYIGGTRSRVCRELQITTAAYDEMHYDLAYDWFKYHAYFEYTARLFLVSPTFHSWWNQQMAFAERAFIEKYGNQGFATGLMRDALAQTITEMNVVPSRELLRLMHAEGMQIMNDNPALKQTKVYRDGTY